MRSAPRGNGSSRALVRHVKLTNRSGLASFRIPRGHRWPLGPREQRCTPRSSSDLRDRERERGRKHGGSGRRTCNPLPLFVLQCAHCPSAYITAKSGFRQYLMRCPRAPLAVPPITGHAMGPGDRGEKGHATCRGQCESAERDGAREIPSTEIKRGRDACFVRFCFRLA